tara:strand:+ start:136 stop:792 length:657 start_codon:yes stop_codon:yes gene_type:complete
MEIAWQLLKAGPPAEAFLPHDIDDEGNVIEENEPPKKDPLRSRLSLQHLARRGDDHAKEMEGERPPGEEPLPEQHMAGQHENTRMNEMAREAAGTMPDLHELEPEMRDDTTTVIRPNRRGEYGERYLGEKHPPRTFRDLNVPEVPHGYEEEEEEPEPDPHDWSPKDRGPYIQRLREMGLMDDDDDKPPTTAQTQGQAEGAMSNDALKLLGREHAMRRR